MEMQRGMRGKLSQYLSPEMDIEVELNITGAAVYDYAAFGLDASDKLSDDRYMVFYNQVKSPEGAVSYREISGGAAFTLNLGNLPASVNKVVFSFRFDGAGTMWEISLHRVFLKQHGRESLRVNL